MLVQAGDGTELTARLEALVDRWRTAALPDRALPGSAAPLTGCASELEAVLHSEWDPRDGVRSA